MNWPHFSRVRSSLTCIEIKLLDWIGLDWWKLLHSIEHLTQNISHVSELYWSMDLASKLQLNQYLINSGSFIGLSINKIFILITIVFDVFQEFDLLYKWKSRTTWWWRWWIQNLCVVTGQHYPLGDQRITLELQQRHVKTFLLHLLLVTALVSYRFP